MMKAIIVREYGPPEVMAVEETNLPEPVGTQVLVKIHAAGVNPVDTYLRSGIHAHAPKLPYTPGKDGAGTIISVGPNVTRFAIGDRVYTAGSISGTYAENSICDETQLDRLPDNISFAEGAGIWTPYATSYRALFQKAECKAGETVLIHGASGGVGLAAVQWASSAGLRVIGTASSEEGRDLILRNGADAAFDHTDIDHFTDIWEATGGSGVDVIIEMLANVNLERDFECLSPFGRIVVVGSRGSIEFTPRLTMTKEATILGMSLFNAPPDAMDEIHKAIGYGLKNETVRPIVAKEYSLEEAAQSHRDIIETKATGKLVIVP
ncbi:NADPH:quinone reductase [Leptolyngbya sp. 7M]|uniref:NADPH:quinone reductase n=1 Tax=Leptolyngbya sp. 7M TaxID=2812896 RepID=UPI001B8B15CD|nr:NADPH:quinone reductase [Leptolyngbya sp. 7M]QYO61967.1 NADPH:quinone reductase [Leptolyngbya sp. 7M]